MEDAEDFLMIEMSDISPLPGSDVAPDVFSMKQPNKENESDSEKTDSDSDEELRRLRPLPRQRLRPRQPLPGDHCEQCVLPFAWFFESCIKRFLVSHPHDA